MTITINPIPIRSDIFTLLVYLLFYNSTIRLSQATSLTLNFVDNTMALYNLIKRQRRHSVIDAVPLSAEKSSACGCVTASILALI